VRGGRWSASAVSWMADRGSFVGAGRAPGLGHKRACSRGRECQSTACRPVRRSRTTQSLPNG
jgi:hypothetical protein